MGNGGVRCVCGLSQEAMCGPVTYSRLRYGYTQTTLWGCSDVYHLSVNTPLHTSITVLHRCVCNNNHGHYVYVYGILVISDTIFGWASSHRLTVDNPDLLHQCGETETFDWIGLHTHFVTGCLVRIAANTSHIHLKYARLEQLTKHNHTNYTW